MVLWNNKLRESRHTRLFSTGVHGAVSVAALLAPWSVNSTFLGLLFFWFPLFAIIISSWVWSQKNIRQCQGRLVLFKGNKVHWQKAAWSITQPPWFHRYGMVVMLHAFIWADNSWADNNNSWADDTWTDNSWTDDINRAANMHCQPPIRLWIASDSMSPAAWRHLNQVMRQYPER